MIVRVLGSAAGGGVPQWNCACNNCMRARRGDAPLRTQSSMAFSPNGELWLLVNASVDLPRQLADAQALWPRELRSNPFRGVLLTDANVDHCAGLGELRQNPEPLLVVSSTVTRDLLAGQRAFERFTRAPHQWIAVEPDAEISSAMGSDVANQLEIEMIDVPGLLPGYAGRKKAHGAVVAYVIFDRASGATITFAPVYAELGARLCERIETSDAVFLDGTFYSDDELRSISAKAKDARALGHAPVGGPGGTLERIHGLGNRRIFVHLNNSNPMLDPTSDAFKHVMRSGCEVASDGWQTEFVGSVATGRSAEAALREPAASDG